MNTLNRRRWLQIAGIAGLATSFNPLETLANNRVGKHLPLSTTGISKLSSNENPFGPSPKVRQAMIDAFDLGCRYPYGKMNELAEKIAQKEGISRDHIVMTAGSTEGLKATGLTYGLNGGEIIAADPVYASLVSYAEHIGAYINRVPLMEDMQQDLDKMANRISNKTTLLFLCNPHNPAGSLVPKESLLNFCYQVADQTILFSDEAYYDYIEEPNYPSMVELVKKGKNVIVSRTFSKVYGLAGLRVGYLIARPDIAARIRPNVMAKANMMAVIAAMTAYEDQEFYEMSLARNKEAKQYIYQTLDELELRYIPSHTNFVFFHTGKDIVSLNQAMRTKNVIIGRPFPPLTDWCRISTGRMEDVEAFGKALREVMA